ncbi:hypothetical protein T10_3999 [Trichinella papuae]|uniref:Uncharacterized protein n=1 Tax=Trichinella papuae TaxID=268474 RepID=A0A0V1M1C1_9BILA|nr:hypothetical protein T10_3999 [Trichinella papuae]
MKTEALANKVEVQRMKIRVMADQLTQLCEGGSHRADIQEVLDEVMASCDKALELQLQFEEALMVEALFQYFQREWLPATKIPLWNVHGVALILKGWHRARKHYAIGFYN